LPTLRRRVAAIHVPAGLRAIRSTWRHDGLISTLQHRGRMNWLSYPSLALI
jgi:hypothetical protein